MKKLIIILLVASLCFLISCKKSESNNDSSILDADTYSPVSNGDLSQNFNDNSSIVFAEETYTVDWYTIKNLPEGFPKLSEYVTFATSSSLVINICWNILSEEKELEFVAAIEKWTGSKMDLTNDGYNIYNGKFEDDKNKYTLNFIYQPDLDGQYDETIGDWSAQARLYIYTESKN